MNEAATPRPYRRFIDAGIKRNRSDSPAGFVCALRLTIPVCVATMKPASGEPFEFEDEKENSRKPKRSRKAKRRKLKRK